MDRKTFNIGFGAKYIAMVTKLLPLFHIVENSFVDLQILVALNVPLIIIALNKLF